MATENVTPRDGVELTVDALAMIIHNIPLWDCYDTPHAQAEALLPYIARRLTSRPQSAAGNTIDPWPTLIAVCDALGVDLHAARNAPGKPSDVILEAAREKFGQPAAGEVARWRRTRQPKLLSITTLSVQSMLCMQHFRRWTTATLNSQSGRSEQSTRSRALAGLWCPSICLSRYLAKLV
jgi:hypothetical protein